MKNIWSNWLKLLASGSRGIILVNRQKLRGFADRNYGQANLSLVAVFASAILVLGLRTGRADVFITGSESGGNTTFTFNGSLDMTTLNSIAPGITTGRLRAVNNGSSSTLEFRGNGSRGSTYVYSAGSTFPVFGSSIEAHSPDFSTGDVFGFKQSAFFVENGWINSASYPSLSGSMTFNGKTLSELVGTPVPFTFTLPNGEKIYMFPAPEILVTGNGVEITDGNTTPSTGDHTDFGTTAVSGGSVIRTFTILNDGDSTLTLGSASTSGAHAADYVVTTQPATSVAPNGTTTIQVTFNPSDGETRSATLSFGNDDSDENPFDFELSGTGLETNGTGLRALIVKFYEIKGVENPDLSNGFIC